MPHDCPELIPNSTIVLHSSGPFAVVRRYFKGHHPSIGVLHYGATGKETEQTITIVKPLHTFQVTEGT